MPKKAAPMTDQIRAHRTFLRRRGQAEAADVDYPITRTSKEILEGTEAPRMRRRLLLGQRAKSRYQG